MPADASNLVSIRNNITSTLISEMVTGRIIGVQAIGQQWLNDLSIFPYVSVWPASQSERIEANRRKRNTMYFTIGLAYKSEISIEDAYENLYNLMDNGQGQGLQAILRDPNNYSWGNLVTYSELSETKYYDNIGASKNAALTTFVAYGIINYKTVQLMQYPGPIH